MSDTPAKPSQILLATDFSARSDRSLDRALALARSWEAELIVTHVIEPEPEAMWDNGDPFAWQRWPEREDEIREMIRSDLGDEAGNARLVIEHGSPVDRIAAVAERTDAGLIVTGVARSSTFGRAILGTTVQRLVRTAYVPVLVVKRRVISDYRKILITFDFSEASAHAVRYAAALFPDASLTLLHGYDAPFLANDRQAFADFLRKAEQQEVDNFLDKAVPDARTRERVDVVIGHGEPVRLAKTYSDEKKPDLTVVASHGRGAVYELAIGSIATKLLAELPSDILLVRRPRPAP